MNKYSKGTFVWHKYDTYIHFKCNDKKCSHSFKLPIWIPKTIQKQTEKSPIENVFKRFRFPTKVIISVLSLYFSSSSSTLFSFISSQMLSKANFNSLSPYRSSTTATQLFQQALFTTKSIPKTIITDRLDSYNVPMAVCYPTTKHYPYHDKTFKAWYKTKKCFKNFCSAELLITVFMFHYNFLHNHSFLNNLSPANVAGITYNKQSYENWKIGSLIKKHILINMSTIFEKNPQHL